MQGFDSIQQIDNNFAWSTLSLTVEMMSKCSDVSRTMSLRKLFHSLQIFQLTFRRHFCGLEEYRPKKVVIDLFFTI